MHKNQITSNHLVLINKLIKKYSTLNKNEVKSFLYGSDTNKSLTNYTIHFNTDKNATIPLISVKINKIDNCRIYYKIMNSSKEQYNFTQINLVQKNTRYLVSAIITTILIKNFRYDINKPIYYKIEKTQTKIGFTFFTKFFLVLALFKSLIRQSIENFKR